MSDISLNNLYSSNKYWKTIDNNIITTNTGNLGIGITTPDYKLHVIGTITSTDNICTSTGYVGIGSTAYNTAKLYIYETGAGTVATKDNGTFVIDRVNVGESSIVFKHKGVPNNYGFLKYVDNAGDSSVMTLGSIGGANNKLNIAPGGGATGLVGINKANPLVALDVTGQVIASNNIWTSGGRVGIGSTSYGSTAKLYIYESTGTDATNVNGTIVLQKGNNNGTNSIVFKHKTTVANYGFLKYTDSGADSSLMTLGSTGGANNKLNIAPGGGATGLVGINKANPLVALDVTGDLAVSKTLSVTGVSTFNNNVTITTTKTLSVGGNTKLTGNVGIGTSPGTGTEKLKVNGAISTNNNNINAGTGTITGNGSGLTNLDMGKATHTGTLAVARGGTGANTFTTNKILFGDGTNAINQNTNLHWDNTNSRLGIGNTNPTVALDVYGAISTNNNNINAGTGTITATTFSGNATSATTASGVAWDNVSGKPGTFPPSSHTHDYASSGHNHDGRYAAASHTHDYASSGHGHSGISFGNPIVLAGCLRAWSTSQSKNDSSDVRYFLIGDTSWSANSSFNYRVKIEGNLWCTNNGLYTTSDKRIKFDIKELNNNNCLKEIRGIKVCKYKNKDILKQIENNRIYSRGFIAQDVKKVLPDAIGINIDENNTIPNIQRLCSISSNILTIHSTSNIILNKNISPIEFIYDYEAKLEDIIEIHIDTLKYNVIINEIISSNIFKIIFEDKIPNPNIDIIEYKDSSNNISYSSNYNYNYNNVFAYGTIIKDFQILDYNYIYTTGIGAIKELDNEIINLKNENILLKNKIDLILNRLYS